MFVIIIVVAVEEEGDGSEYHLLDLNPLLWFQRIGFVVVIITLWSFGGLILL